MSGAEVREVGDPRRVSISFPGEGRTKQSFRDECDINILMARLGTTGQVNHQNSAQPWFGDFSNVLEYRDAVHLARDAEEAFAALSAKVRNRFDNEPGNLLAFMEDPANQKEAIQLGLFEAKPVPTPPKAEEKPPPDPDPPAKD